MTKRFKRKFAWSKCESTLPRPEHKYCLYPDCGAELDSTHWACRLHWILYPKGFRFYANSFRNFWEGHPPYDIFVQKAQELGAKLAAGEVCTVWEPKPEDYEAHAVAESERIAEAVKAKAARAAAAADPDPAPAPEAAQ